MSRPIGFSMVINEIPENSARCDVCNELAAPGVKRVSTYIGTSPQSNLCIECMDEIIALAPKRRIPSETKLRVEAVV